MNALPLETLCRRAGQPVTAQRRVVHAALSARRDHPTADGLFADVQRVLPGVSRTTIYRVLETLVRVGAATRISHPGAAARFEARAPDHDHLVCDGCGAVRDVERPPGPAPASPDGLDFTVRTWSVTFRGTCAPCASRPPQHEGAPS